MHEIEGIRDMILVAAKELAANQGIASLSIRQVAGKCGVAVGSVYNYFPTKGDLIAEIVESFWRKAFEQMDFATIQKLPPVSALAMFYLQLSSYLTSFKVNWLEQLSLLSSTDKQTGRVKEQAMFARISALILSILQKSEAVKSYTQPELEKLAVFIFDNMLAMLRRDEQDFSFAERLLSKLLH